MPKAWCPPFVGISIQVHSQWLNGKGIDFSAIEKPLNRWINLHRDNAGDGYLLRSSGVGETIRDHGQLISENLPQEFDLSNLAQATETIFKQAKQVAPDRSIGLVLQIFYPAVTSGHVSNEFRVSPTRNQWRYEILHPHWTAKGIYSGRSLLPSSSQSLSCGLKGIHPSFRSIGRWLTKTVKHRCHVEWLLNGDTLWLVQLDPDWPELDSGYDPKKQNDYSFSSSPDRTAANVFQNFDVGSDSQWKKLKNLNEFDFNDDHPHPILYYATAAEIKSAIKSKKDRSLLVKEIDTLTAGRAVLRTDISTSKKASFNLPRTDTVNGSKALSWLSKRISEFIEEGISLDEICFVLHAFIPAKAAAWAFAKPGNPIVDIDSIWGLPDGLQVLDHDSFQVDVTRNRILEEKIRYKPRFLIETKDGCWDYVSVSNKRGRSRSLSKKTLLELASRTAAIADKLTQPAHLMWFCGVPEIYGVGCQ